MERAQADTDEQKVREEQLFRQYSEEYFQQNLSNEKKLARGGRINPTAGVADVGQRHSGGGIRMVDGAMGQHLGEWEKGEAYMILSRDTYANNKYLVDELIDTSLYRGGAPGKPKPGYFEDGGGTAARRPRRLFRAPKPTVRN